MYFSLNGRSCLRPSRFCVPYSAITLLGGQRTSSLIQQNRKFLSFRLIHISIIILTIVIIISTPPLLLPIPYPFLLCSTLCYFQVVRWWKRMIVHRCAYSLIGSLNLSEDLGFHIFTFTLWRKRERKNLTLGLTVASQCCACLMYCNALRFILHNSTLSEE